jgi:putative sigma-54 modulation protein
MRLISLKSTNMDLTDAIRAYVEEKVETLRKLCEEFHPADDLQVEVGKSSRHHAKGPFYHAEMMLRVPGKEFRAESEAEDLYAAVDDVKDQMRRQLADYKDRIHDKNRVARPGKE